MPCPTRSEVSGRAGSCSRSATAPVSYSRTTASSTRSDGIPPGTEPSPYLVHAPSRQRGLFAHIGGSEATVVDESRLAQAMQYPFPIGFGHVPPTHQPQRIAAGTLRPGSIAHQPCQRLLRTFGPLSVGPCLLFLLLHRSLLHTPYHPRLAVHIAPALHPDEPLPRQQRANAAGIIFVHLEKSRPPASSSRAALCPISR